MRKGKKSEFYVDNKRLYEILCEYHKGYKVARRKKQLPPTVPPYAIEAFVRIAAGMASKKNFAMYSYIDEMQADAIENCFHGEEQFLTLELGPVSFKNVVGQTLTVKTKDGWKPAVVKSYGVQKIFEFGFGSASVSMSSIRCKVQATENHRWPILARLNKRGLREFNEEVVTDLREGDVLTPVVDEEKRDPEAVIHGLIFGDGTGHKSQSFNETVVVQQGNRYASIRVCKQDSARQEIMSILENAGYKAQYRQHANGDPIYWLGRKAFIKDLPFTNDPEYISGFIHGWWLADGQKTAKENRVVISTSNEMAASWLEKYCAYAGLFHVSTRVTGRKPGEGSFENGKPLFTITLAKNNFLPTVRYKKYIGEAEVFCVEEPVTKTFTLANGLLTGNCVVQAQSFDPEIGSNPHAYFSAVVWNAFVRRIKKERKQQYIKYKNYDNIMIADELMGIPRSKTSEVNDISHEYVRSFEEGIQKKQQSTVKKKKPPIKIAKTETRRLPKLIKKRKTR